MDWANPNPPLTTQTGIAVPLPLAHLRPAFAKRAEALLACDLKPAYAAKLRAVDGLLKGNTFTGSEICFAVDTLTGSPQDEDRRLARVTAMALLPTVAQTAAGHMLEYKDPNIAEFGQASVAAVALLQVLTFTSPPDLRVLCEALATLEALGWLEVLGNYIGGPLLKTFSATADAHRISLQIASNIKILLKVLKG